MSMCTRTINKSLVLEIINIETGEVLKVGCKPEELLIVTKTINTLNSDGQFEINRIISYGDEETLQQDNSLRLTWQRRKEN